jgi:hypothetical protein
MSMQQQGFLIRLREITADDAYKLYLFARTRCSEYRMVPEQTNPKIILFMGILNEPVCPAKFMRNMRKNLSNWNIEHITNQLWLEELTVEEYMRVCGGFSQLKSKAVSDEIVRDLANKEVAAILKVKSMQLCERQVMQQDRFITRAVFNAFRSNVKEQEHKRRKTAQECNNSPC